MKKLEFFWDVGSPYTYLAMTQVKGLRDRSGATLVYRPFLLGGVFKAVGNKMVDVVPKASNLMIDLRRWADFYRVPMKVPPEVIFPINSLLPMRAAMAAMLQSEVVGEAYAHAVMHAYWGEGKNVSEPPVLSQVISAAGLDARALIDATEQAEVKNALRANTEEAVARGAFGAPAFFVGDQLFWGNDRLHFVEKALIG
ncbi:MAG: 2-hydroxychromene-2-carboxylate isomerase [Myxococcota bacterium]